MKLAKKQPVPFDISKVKISETQSQARIRKLQEEINSQNQDDTHGFTAYKIITYLCTIFFPLVPYALYRIWCPKTEFSPREQKVWSGVIGVIAAYAIFLAH